MSEPTAGGPGPVRPGERLLAPDLARGLALLGIALANSVVHLYERELGPLLRPVDGTTLDRVVDGVVGLLVDNRALPMFTMLFAYGYVMILRRQAAAGVPWPQARALVLRRSAWLAAIGAAHMLLLFVGDIVLTYGLLGLALVLVVRWSDRALRLLGASTLVVLAGLGALDGVSGTLRSLEADGGVTDRATFGGDLAFRALTLVGVLAGAPVYVLALAPPAVLGILLARRGVLEDPAANLPLLRRMSACLLPSLLGAVPLVLMSTQLVPYGLLGAGLAAALHGVTGLFGAVAFLGLLGWFVAARPGRTRTDPSPSHPLSERPATGGRPRGVVGALAAVGRRSLTCYLLQSVLLVPLLSPWALGLADGAGTLLVTTVAVAVYLVTVAVAVVLEGAGRQGPAERLLRGLTYRTSAAVAPGHAAGAGPRPL